MPYCNRRQCRQKGIDLPDSEFKDAKGRTTKACKACRIRMRDEWKRTYYKLNNRARGAAGADALHAILKVKEELEVGDPPRFNFAWEKDRYQLWLTELSAIVKSTTNDLHPQ